MVHKNKVISFTKVVFTFNLKSATMNIVHFDQNNEFVIQMEVMFAIVLKI